MRGIRAAGKSSVRCRARTAREPAIWAGCVRISPDVQRFGLELLKFTRGSRKDLVSVLAIEPSGSADRHARQVPHCPSKRGASRTSRGAAVLNPR